MQQPSFLFFIILIVVAILLVSIGIFFLARFNSLFKGVIKDDWLRRNVVVWIIICCFSGAIWPMSGNFFYIISKYGWFQLFIGHLLTTSAFTLIAYNLTHYISEHEKIKQLSFFKQKIIVVLVVIFLIMVINMPFTYMVYDNKEYIKFSYLSSFYFGAIIGLIYVLLSYLDLEKQKQFDEKELELSRLRELKTKAELEALHSKINPHFLYNALNSIADLSVTDGKKARKMTISLADLFRYSINYSDHNYSTVKDELAMAESYLQIEKIRFEDRLNYTIYSTDEISAYLMPRFILQPLVENAVKHGLKATGKVTELVIHTKLENQSLVISVADDGPDFPEEINPGYGVKSIFDKLDLLFPNAYSVKFLNEPQKQVLIQINKLIKNEPTV